MPNCREFMLTKKEQSEFTNMTAYTIACILAMQKSVRRRPKWSSTP